MPQVKEALWELIDEMTSGTCWCGTFRTTFESDIHFELSEGRVLAEKRLLELLVASLKEECDFSPRPRQLVHLLNSWDLTLEQNFGFNIDIVDGEQTVPLIKCIGEVADELSRTIRHN